MVGRMVRVDYFRAALLVLILPSLAASAGLAEVEPELQRFSWAQSSDSDSRAEALLVRHLDPDRDPEEATEEIFVKTPGGHRIVLSRSRDRDVVQGDVLTFEDLESGFTATLEVLGDGPLPKNMGWEFWENHSFEELTWFIVFETSHGVRVERTLDPAVPEERALVLGEPVGPMLQELEDEAWFQELVLDSSTVESIRFLGPMLDTMRKEITGWRGLRAALTAYVDATVGNGSSAHRSEQDEFREWVGASHGVTPTAAGSFLEEYRRVSSSNQPATD